MPKGNDTEIENKDSQDNDQETVTVKDADDLKKLLAKVRSEEKNKLYPQIEHFKKQVETIQKEKADLETRLAALEDDGKKKTNSEKNEILKQLEEIREENAVLRKRQEALVEESRKAIEEQRLEAYRAKAIAGAGDQVIPELVVGTTEAEIDAAVIASRKRYTEIFEGAKKALKGTAAHARVPGATGNPPSDTTKPTAEELTAEMLREMTPEQWAKERLNIRKAVDGSMKSFFRGGR